MRDVEEREIWARLLKARAHTEPQPFMFEAGSIDLSRPCTILGGRNGAGKTRALKAIAKAMGDEGVFLNLHHLIEQAHILYRSRDDLDEIADEAGSWTPTEDRTEDIQKIIGRAYDSVEWSELDLVPSEDEVAEVFKWRRDQAVVPYFRVTHLGRTYTSPDMGLGEFSVHFLFWILEQFADQKGLTLLLDEPDAFLPPKGVRSLLASLQGICLRRDWRLIISTHSEELISKSMEHDAFLLLRLNDAGETEVIDTTVSPVAGHSLLARPPVEQVLFVEDEVAAALLEALMRHADPSYMDRVTIVWCKGEGDMRELIRKLPRPPRPRVRFAFVFDGDQRDLPVEEGTGWPIAFLPTSEEPDRLLRSTGAQLTVLAHQFATTPVEMTLFLDSIAGENPHDWVIKLGDKYERRRIITALAHLWAADHPDECREILEAVAHDVA